MLWKKGIGGGSFGEEVAAEEAVAAGLEEDGRARLHGPRFFNLILDSGWWGGGVPGYMPTGG